MKDPIRFPLGNIYGIAHIWYIFYLRGRVGPGTMAHTCTNITGHFKAHRYMKLRCTSLWCTKFKSWIAHLEALTICKKDWGKEPTA
jgi:hypothetical protein